MPLSRSLARFNRVVTNRVSGLVAAYLPGFGVVFHRGRRSGAPYRTPVNVFRRDGGYTFALTYGRGDWVENVLAAGSAELLARNRRYRVVNPTLFVDPTRAAVPKPVRVILGWLDVDEFMHVEVDRAATAR